MRIFLSSAAVISAAILTPAAFGQTVISSAIVVAVSADANQLDGSISEQVVTDSQSATIHDLAGVASRTNNDQVNSGRWLTVDSQASAHWNSASSGTVTWRNMGWTTNTIVQTGSKLNSFVSNAPVWEYTFRADGDGTFVLNYNVSSTGDPFGLLGLVIEWSGAGGGLDLTNAYNPAANGTFTASLTAGTTYTIGLANSGNIFTAAFDRQHSDHMNADFDWNIQAVPEVDSMIPLSFALVVFALRRRR